MEERSVPGDALKYRVSKRPVVNGAGVLWIGAGEEFWSLERN